MLVIKLGLFARDTLGVKVREDMPYLGHLLHIQVELSCRWAEK